jgi:hypothetical protein
MATGNAAATLERATDWSTDFASATLVILDGATPLATHTVPSFTPSNSGADGLATAAAIANDTIDASGTADSATLTAAGKVYTLTVGLSGADLNLSTLTYVIGETSSITSLVVTFPA